MDIRFKIEEMDNDKLFIEDKYLHDLFDLTNKNDVLHIIEWLNIANKVLGNEFEATYEDVLYES